MAKLCFQYLGRCISILQGAESTDVEASHQVKERGRDCERVIRLKVNTGEVTVTENLVNFIDFPVNAEDSGEGAVFIGEKLFNKCLG